MSQLAPPILPPPTRFDANQFQKRNWLADELLTTLPILVSDLAAFAVACLASAAVMSIVGYSGLALASLGPAIFAVLVLLFAINALYPGVALNPILELRRIVLATALSFVACALFVFGSEIDLARIAALGMTWLATTVAIPVTRGYARRYLARSGFWGRSALLVGDAEAVERTMGKAEQFRLSGLRPHPFVLGGAQESWAEIADLAPRHLILCTDSSLEEAIRGAATEHFRQVHVLAPTLMDTFGQSWLEAADVAAMPALKLQNRLKFRRYALAKRAIDIGVCLLAMPILLPLCGALALLVKLTSPGPIFFGHRRLGRDGCVFRVWKFRTMVTNAQEALDRYLEKHPELAEEWARTHKLRHDPRITPIGQFLRKTSLDELPQIWSVLTGKMSLVGPRPIVVEEIDKYGEIYRLYKQVTPGITGLWQVSGRNDTTYEERVALDASYVRNWSIWLDMFVLFRTVKTVAKREGAC